MVATIGKVTAGAGYEYLTNDVATGSHDYYTGAGEAPGRWSGQGLDTLGLVDGELVAEEQMEALFGMGVDWRTMPAAGAAPTQMPAALGRRFPAPTLNTDGTVRSSAVAGFDLQFAPSKSVSALWAVADPALRRRIEELHDAAIDAAFGYVERHAAYSRAGAGGVRQVDTEGMIVARFQHRTSRNGDPQLHTHCAILNRLKCSDGAWRSLDARHLYQHGHTAGAVYAREFEAQLTVELGVSWTDEVENGRFREIVGVPDDVRHLWSSRTREINDCYASLHQDWWDTHGYEPTRAQRAQLHQQATLATRQAKEGVELHDRWRTEIGDELVAQVVGVVGGKGAPVEDRDSWDSQRVGAAVKELSAERATMNRAQIARGVLARMGICPDAGTMIDALVDEVIADPMMVELTRSIEPLTSTPGRGDGESLWQPHQQQKFTTVPVLNAEQRLLDAVEQSGKTIDAATVTEAIDSVAADGHALSPDQRAAVELMTTGGHRLSTVIGPAGAGKTTTMRAAVSAWKNSGGRVIGLSLSQNAANVLGDEARCDTYNVAQWATLVEQQGVEQFQAGDLVIVDEAAMVPTLTLDWLVRRAAEADANIVFVGDYQQLPSPEAGGIVRDLAHSAGGTWLTGVHRFRNDWERDASLALRDMAPGAADMYAAHGRIVGVTGDESQREIVDAWWSDTRAGHETVLLAPTNAEAAELSAQAQSRLIAAGNVDHRKVIALADQNRSGAGDLIQTRRNARDLMTDTGRAVANRDVWTVLEVGEDGSLMVAGTSGRVRLPADYASEHAALAYAGTIHAVQGRTVDRAHVLVTSSTDHAALYVGLTRGRDSNVAHVITDGHDHEEFGLGHLGQVDAFRAAMNRDSNERSALEQVRATYDGMRLDELHAIADDVRLHGAERLIDDLAGERGLDNFKADEPLLQVIAQQIGRADIEAAVRHENLGGGTVDRRILDRLARLPATEQPAGGVLREHHEQLGRLNRAIGQRHEMLAEYWRAQPAPPKWAFELLVAESWHPDPRRREQQRNIVAKVAAYRERHQITEPNRPVTREHTERPEWRRFIRQIRDTKAPAATTPRRTHEPDFGR